MRPRLITAENRLDAGQVGYRGRAASMRPRLITAENLADRKGMTLRRAQLQ